MLNQPALAEYARPLRIRQAVLVTALQRLGGALVVSRHDVAASAGHDVDVAEDEAGFRVTLKPAPAEAKG